jgi:uncharacterized cupin superfamily protein
MPGESNALYHAESAQEGFLVLAGECRAVVEGRERRLRQWDYLHCPPGTAHVLIGDGDGPCAILMVGAPRSASLSSILIPPTPRRPATEPPRRRRRIRPSRRTPTATTRPGRCARWPC